MDAKVWTVGATLFALLYLTLGVLLVWSALVVALVLAAWVLGLETEGPEGLKYVELELRPALSFVGIFALSVVILGPHFPPVLSTTLYPVQYASPMSVLRKTPVMFYFALVPLLTGSLMTMHQRFHPLGGILYQTPPSPSTRVHVHLHTSKAASRSRDEEDEEEGDEEEEAPRPRHHHHRPLEIRHRLKAAHPWKSTSAKGSDHEDDEEDGEEEVVRRPLRLRRHPHRALRSSDSAEL
ncbi:MAG: hypothetical protein KGJ23_09655 [Euryarchaeota archaeon]|nr:hypothetical protein [Euryarchaeota archaeon]MDE1836867.1 hypothetical protein [Euryarchaeota archaeon]MDE1879746.1 hypothetical protein [Euryarchaeota archaeon]MDE2046031.1 hypothetical protein [Thermoplasmata archaeon]